MSSFWIGLTQEKLAQRAVSAFVIAIPATACTVIY
jgi:hypothetical protein